MKMLALALAVVIPTAALARDRDYRDGEQVDPNALLDPYVAEHLEAASVKYGWSGAFKFSGATSIAAGVVLLAVLPDSDRKASAYPLVWGLVSVLVGVAIDSAASSDYEMATRRMRELR